MIWAEIQWDMVTLNNLIWSLPPSGWAWGLPGGRVGMVTTKQYINLPRLQAISLFFAPVIKTNMKIATWPGKRYWHNIIFMNICTYLFRTENTVRCSAGLALRLFICYHLHVALFLLTVAVDGSLRVDWSVASSLSDLTLLGSTRTSLARRLILTAPLGALDFSEVPLTIFFTLSFQLGLVLECGLANVPWLTPRAFALDHFITETGWSLYS